MTFQLHSQHVDLDSLHHVIELRDEQGNRHFLQIALGEDCCVACGAIRPKDNLGELEPKIIVAQANEALNRSRGNVRAYAEKHGLKVK